MSFSLRQLEYFVSVAEHGHFGRAAEACGVSQPGLSAQLRALEESLGVSLFERSNKRVLRTTSGDALLPFARRVLSASDNLLDAARLEADPSSGRLRLGVIPTVAPYLLPRFLPRLRRDYPNLRLTLREDQTGRLLEQLEHGDLDLLLLALPVEGPFESLVLFEEAFFLLTPDEHPLAQRGRRRVKTKELLGEDVLLLEDGHCLRDQALEVCMLAGARESDLARASSMTTLVQMVEAGIGVTFLPESAVAVEVHADSELFVRAFAPPVPSRTIGLVWRKETARTELFRALGKLVPRVRFPASKSS